MGFSLRLRHAANRPIRLHRKQGQNAAWTTRVFPPQQVRNVRLDLISFFAIQSPDEIRLSSPCGAISIRLDLQPQTSPHQVA